MKFKHAHELYLSSYYFFTYIMVLYDVVVDGRRFVLLCWIQKAVFISYLIYYYGCEWIRLVSTIRKELRLTPVV